MHSSKSVLYKAHMYFSSLSDPLLPSLWCSYSHGDELDSEPAALSGLRLWKLVTLWESPCSVQCSVREIHREPHVRNFVLMRGQDSPQIIHRNHAAQAVLVVKIQVFFQYLASQLASVCSTVALAKTTRIRMYTYVYICTNTTDKIVGNTRISIQC